MSFIYLPFTLSATGGGGGSSSGGGLVTVGESGMYPTVNAALAATHNVLFINSYTGESGDITIPSSGLYINILPGGRLNMGANKFSLNDAGLIIEGHGAIQYNHTVPNTLFDGNDNSSLKVEGVELLNNSSAFSFLTDVNSAKFSEVSFNGNVNLDSDKNILSDCRYTNGNLTIASGVQNTLIGGAIFDGMLIIDSGNGTVISDGVVV